MTYKPLKWANTNDAVTQAWIEIYRDVASAVAGRRDVDDPEEITQAAKIAADHAAWCLLDRIEIAA